MATCVVCHGMKGSVVLACPGARSVFIPCEACEGTGELTEERAADLARWKMQGETIRRARIDMRTSMRDAAAMYGIDAPRYSRIEFGLEPAPWLA